MIGRIHSIETLGAVDGPGVRMVIFMQGCLLRCAYCHNPDTWDTNQGQQIKVETLVEKVLRYQTYFGSKGGVTLSGGEPLLQAGFAMEFFKQLKSLGISTAIDTAGIPITDEVVGVLRKTDVVLLDIKMTDEKSYYQYTAGSLKTTMEFLDTASKAGCRIWIRHVVIPGINDTIEDMNKLRRLLQNSGVSVERVELLPYHGMGIDKYKQLGLSYRLNHVPDLKPELFEILSKAVRNR